VLLILAISNKLKRVFLRGYYYKGVKRLWGRFEGII